jgi:hypothetical protein
MDRPGLEGLLIRKNGYIIVLPDGKTTIFALFDE